jgi:hypothetical protein
MRALRVFLVAWRAQFLTPSLARPPRPAFPAAGLLLAPCSCSVPSTRYQCGFKANLGVIAALVAIRPRLSGDIAETADSTGFNACSSSPTLSTASKPASRGAAARAVAGDSAGQSAVTRLPAVSGVSGTKTTPEPMRQAATEQLATTSRAAAAHEDILAAIERLAELYARGVLTKAEFSAKKAELLDRL